MRPGYESQVDIHTEEQSSVATIDVAQDRVPVEPMEQYSLAQILGFWLLAAFPMGLLAWLVFPALRDGVNVHPGIFLWALMIAGLMWQVVLSNIDLVRRIWDPTLPIRPTWQRLDIKVTSPLAKTLYANSITLTPGTLTTDVREDHFMVHSLSPDGIEDLRKGGMEEQILRLGI